MDLKIKDVAELLSVSETTIRRWLQDGKIPAYKFNRQYRFSRIEIENWMMEQKLNLSDTSDIQLEGEKQIYPLSEVEDEPHHPVVQPFSFYRALTRGGVFHDVPGDTKEEVIRNVVQKIAPTLRLEPEILTDMLLEREKLMPTSFNNGMAVPHARECLQHVAFDLIAVVFPQKPLDYGALDGKPVDILFFLFASSDKTHLHLLAKIAHLCSDAEAHAFVKGHPEKANLLTYIKEWESKIK